MTVYDKLEIERMIKGNDHDLASDIEYIKCELKGIKETLAVYHQVIARLNKADMIIADSLEIINDELSKKE